MTEKSAASPAPRRSPFSKSRSSTGCTRCGRWPWRWGCVGARRWVLPGLTSTWTTAVSRSVRRCTESTASCDLEHVKTEASVAVLPIPAPLVGILRGHRSRQLEERFAAGSDWRDTGLVFTSATGGFLEPRNINRVFHTLCARAGVPQLRVHDLRHSCATLLFTMGVAPATVQRILRHSSITVTTGTYVEVIEAVQRDALDSMGSLFEPAGDELSGRLPSRMSSNGRK